jgi:hypothetical protein
MSESEGKPKTLISNVSHHQIPEDRQGRNALPMPEQKVKPPMSLKAKIASIAAAAAVVFGVGYVGIKGYEDHGSPDNNPSSTDTQKANPSPTPEIIDLTKNEKFPKPTELYPGTMVLTLIDQKGKGVRFRREPSTDVYTGYESPTGPTPSAEETPKTRNNIVALDSIISVNGIDIRNARVISLTYVPVVVNKKQGVDPGETESRWGEVDLVVVENNQRVKIKAFTSESANAAPYTEYDRNIGNIKFNGPSIEYPPQDIGKVKILASR